MLLDLLLLLMIIICVVYCWILNKRIGDLQNSRIEFARMIKELNASIVKAENNVNEMSELSKITSSEINAAVSEARDISGELVTISEVASELFAKLNNQSLIIRSADSAEEAYLDEAVYENISAKAGERFTENDLAPPADEEENGKYTNHLKNFIQNIVSKKSEEQNVNLNQTSYYDTLRKINAKK
jgi:hypothetical protein